MHRGLVLAAFIPLFVFRVDSQYPFGCTSETCKKCSDSECSDGRIVKNATFCGCCDICIKTLNEGESCITEYKAILDDLKECGPGLTCDNQTKKCVPANTNCVKKKRKKSMNFQSNKLNMIQQTFECDEFGFYKPVVCIPNISCYCVDKDGKRIFGTAAGNKTDELNCDCSREINDFPREVDDGNFPRCLPNGNYDPLQCTEDWCFCTDSYEDDVVNATAPIDELTCYNKNRHINNKLRSKCLEEREKQIISFKDKNFTAIGVDVVRCDLDGSYYPVQCKKSSCYCVRRNGKIFLHYDVPRYSKEAKSMTCRCLRDKEMLKGVMKKSKSMEFFEKFECDALGNYRSKQYVDSISFYVDEMGQPIDEDYH